MPERSDAPPPLGSECVSELLERIKSGDLSDLMSIWNGRDRTAWDGSPEIYRALAKGILGEGEPLFACDVIGEGLTIWPNDVRLRQLQGVALSRSGATERANAGLEQLRKEGQHDEETLG